MGRPAQGTIASPPAPILILFLSFSLLFHYGCAGTGSQREAVAEKIAFDLSRLNADGLQGQPDGLRALHYEFCIPAQPEFIDEVTGIDTTLIVYPDVKGRISCGADEFLCLGNTHQPEHAAVLTRLARLPYIRRIEESFFEH